MSLLLIKHETGKFLLNTRLAEKFFNFVGRDVGFDIA